MHMEEPSGTSRPKLPCHRGTNSQKSELAELQFSGRATFLNGLLLFSRLHCHLGMESGQRRNWSLWRQSIQQPPQKTGAPCFSPRNAQFTFLKVYAWKIQLCTLLSGRTVAVLSLAICHFSSRLRNCSDLEIFLRFFLHPLQSKITDLCSNKSLLEIFREKKE